MFIVVFENDEVIESAVDVFNNRFNPSSRLNLTKDNVDTILKKISHPPLLDIGWLIYVFDTSDRVLKGLSEAPENNVYFIKISSRKKLEKIFNQLNKLKIKFKYVDNNNVKKEKLVKYVLDNLNICESDAKYLVNRCHSYQPEIMSEVRFLKSYKYVTRSIIKECFTRYSNIPVYELSNFLMGIDTKYSSKDMVNLVYQYRYGFDSLMDTTRRLIKEYITVFNYIISGDLDIDNFSTQKHDLSSEIRLMPDFRLYNIILNFNIVSMNWIYYLDLVLSNLEKGNSGIYKVVKLINVCGGMN